MSPEPPYSPALRTAVVLVGTGTSGAYHAGVLRALHEAGVRVDLLAGRGVGAIAAMFGSIDGGARLWDADSLWRATGSAQWYAWRPRLRAAGWALAFAAAALLLPFAVLLGIGAMYIVAWVMALAGATSLSTTIAAAARQLLDALFDPAALPTIVPRLGMLAVLVAALILAVAAWRASRGRARHDALGLGAIVGAPLDSRPFATRAIGALWDLIRGAAQLASPDRAEISRRYSEMLAENIGQPGFRELLLVAHDIDARQDLTFALLGEPYRTRLFGRRAQESSRFADAIDLSGAGRGHALDALAAALTVPIANDPHIIHFAPEGYWRGEAHRICDRPGATVRLLEEVAAAGAEQVILVSGNTPAAGPHALVLARGDVLGRVGEHIAAAESAALRDADAVARALGVFRGVFQIRPAHNPLGPFDFDGAYDARSDRTERVAELIDRGYEDAYRHFIEPVVGASGERLQHETT